MTPEIWRRAFEIFDQVVDLDPSVREDRLSVLAAGEPEVLGAVRSLLSEADAADTGSSLPLEEVLDAARALVRAGHAPAPGELIGEQYRLEESLGEGGAGTVHRARDTFNDETVAVKLVRPGPGTTIPRVRREVAALELLQLPGVVQILDHGVSDGLSYIVMEEIDGVPFPGREGPLPWSDLAPIAERLVEALARVHAAGVVHRDLKPGNVLVGHDGSPTILDFGLSWGPALGAALTASGTFLGTPAYLAPEQAAGRRVDARADIYALGAMLYEALAGTAPIEDDDPLRLIRTKLSQTPPPLSQHAPDVPSAIADLVDEMLAVRPEMRPQSAAEILQRLESGAPTATPQPSLPRLGAAAALDAVLRAALDGTACDVGGPRGSGRSRLLQDAADELGARGRDVFWVLPGTQPLSGLSHLLASDAAHATATLAEMQASLRETLAGRLRDGDVCIQDDAHRVDRWSAEVVAACRSAGAVIQVVPPGRPADVTLEPLEPADLAPLFHGPDRVLHLREDGAQELWNRAGGLPARVVSTLHAWCRAGLAHWRDGRIALTPETLALLRSRSPRADAAPMASPLELSSGDDELLSWITLAWPEANTALISAAAERPVWQVEAAVETLIDAGALHRQPDGRLQPLCSPVALLRWTTYEIAAAHRALADNQPESSVARLRHLLAAGADADLVAAARDLVDRFVDEGRAADAFPIAEATLDAVRGDVALEQQLVPVLACAAIATHGARALRRAIHRTTQLRDPSAETATVARLLAGAQMARDGAGRAAVEFLEEVGELTDTRLEIWRQGHRAMAARSLDADQERAILDDITAWAAASSPEVQESVSIWEASFAYRNAEYRRYAELLLDAADRCQRPVARLVQLTNAASGLLEDHAFAEAETVARTALQEGRRARHTVVEARAEYVLRAAAYRRGDELETDEELLDASSHVGEPHVEALIHLTEAAVAWRRSDGKTAQRLALRARRLWDAIAFVPGAHLAAALASGDAESSRSARSFALDTESHAEMPGIALQILALVPAEDDAPRVRSAAGHCIRALPHRALSHRREILSPDECVARLGIQ